MACGPQCSALDWGKEMENVVNVKILLLVKSPLSLSLVGSQWQVSTWMTSSSTFSSILSSTVTRWCRQDWVLSPHHCRSIILGMWYRKWQETFTWPGHQMFLASFAKQRSIGKSSIIVWPPSFASLCFPRPLIPMEQLCFWLVFSRGINFSALWMRKPLK